MLLIVHLCSSISRGIWLLMLNVPCILGIYFKFVNSVKEQITVSFDKGAIC